MFFLSLCFLFNKVKEQEGRTGSAQKWGAGWGKVDSIMYTHVSQYKNDKNKKNSCLSQLFIIILL
jgi:hypothetical protein